MRETKQMGVFQQPTRLSLGLSDNPSRKERYLAISG
jgi:hypothetical protein